MKQLISSRNVFVVGKLCLLMLALSLLCPTAPSYAALIESNGTGKYEITGNDTWGVGDPLISKDEEVSSLIINEGASLTLQWPDEYTSYANIYGNGNMEISGGGDLVCDLTQAAGVSGSQILGLNSIQDITLSTVGIGRGNFMFQAFPYNTFGGDYQVISSGAKNLTVKNVRQSAQSDMWSSFMLGTFTNKNVDINGDISILLEGSDFQTMHLLQATNSVVNISGGSEISVIGSTVISSSLAVDKYGVGGSIWNSYVLVADSDYQELQPTHDTSYRLLGKSNMMIKDVTVASQTTDGYLGIFIGPDTTCMSNKWNAVSEIESSYAEISDIRFEGAGQHSLHVSGGGAAVGLLGYDNGNIVQYLGRAESKISGTSEIVISGSEIYSSLADGSVYCGGIVQGDNSISTVGSACLTLKDMNVPDVQWGTGVISGQGYRQEYQNNDIYNIVLSDYTDSVLGDSVLVLDNVKADMSSDTDKVTVKYFDEIQIANNTAVKLTTLDADVKRLTVTGEWGAEVTALEFKQPVQNFASITVDCSAASGVTDAYFTDDGMKFIINGTGGATPEEPSDPEQPSTGGSGGGSGGCNAGFGSFALLAMAAFVSIAGMKFRKK